MDNNCFGVSLVATIGPALALGLARKKWWDADRWPRRAALILHTTLLTFSRGAMVGLLAVGVDRVHDDAEAAQVSGRAGDRRAHRPPVDRTAADGAIRHRGGRL